MPRRRLLRLVKSLPGVRRGVRLVRTVRQVHDAYRMVPDAYRMVSDADGPKTFYPNADRKSTREMTADNVRYFLKHRELDSHYFQYGLDRRGKSWDDVVPYEEFRRIRDTHNRAASGATYNYICLVRDKFIFGQLVESLGYSTPRNLAFLDATSFERLAPREAFPLEALLDAPLDGFCKPFDGIRGEGAFALRVEDGQPVVNGSPATLDEVRARLTGRFLLQERMTQHPALALFHPASVNALRVITVLEAGTARLFSTHLRVGAHGEPTNSVGVGGGFAVAIDPASGCVVGDGLTRDGFRPSHPDTDVRFDGCEIPFFHDAVALACRLHEDIRHLHSVGWDVAISPEGPVFIEGNDNWGGSITMALEPDFKERFLALRVEQVRG